MSRVSVTDRVQLLWLLLRGGLRRLAGRLSGRLPLRWGFAPLRADRLLIAPQDLRTADATRVSEIYAGRFAFAGKIVVCDGRSVFEMTPPSEEWATALLGFGWLRHLRAAESAITRANARALVDEWIALQGGWHPLGWRPDVLSRRVVSWLSQTTLLLQGADARFYRRFLRSLIRQVRCLRCTAGEARRGVARLQACVALCYAALCIASQARHIRAATARLNRELERQILPDGGHVGRNPGAVISVLLELLPLRQVFASRNIAPPQALVAAIDRMMPMLRFFRHSEGTFAHFNGMSTTPADLIMTLLAYDESRGAPFANAPHSAYQRLEAGGGVLIMDTGGAPPLEMSLEAHAGCLAFEFSSPRRSLIIVNCGIPATSREDWRRHARATAAHSTVTFNDTSSAQFVESVAFRRMLGGVPMLGGPRRVTVTRESRPDSILLRAAHDGYVERYGIVHQRTLVLAADGTRLEGEDLFQSADGGQVLTTRDEYAVRFHLHPAIRAALLADGGGATLTAPNKEVWTFNAHVDRVELEDSVYLAATDGPRRTLQLVIRGHARRAPRVVWTLQQAGSAAGAAAAANEARVEGAKPSL